MLLNCSTRGSEAYHFRATPAKNRAIRSRPGRLTCEDRGAILCRGFHRRPPPTTEPGSTVMNRREFLQVGAASSGLVLSGACERAPAAEFAAPGVKRVGLIGSGWYGKIDLLRLLQVAPVEVVSLCDVDRKMLAEAAEIVAPRQRSKKTPRTYA